jgi:hypothetical protein
MVDQKLSDSLALHQHYIQCIRTHDHASLTNATFQLEESHAGVHCHIEQGSGDAVPGIHYEVFFFASSIASQLCL